MQKYYFCILFFSISLDERSFFVYNVEKPKKEDKNNEIGY